MVKGLGIYYVMRCSYRKPKLMRFGDSFRSFLCYFVIRFAISVDDDFPAKRRRRPRRIRE